VENGKKVQYLEGLRGLAAALVIVHHFLLAFYPSVYFGDPKTVHTTHFIELAYFRSPLSALTNGNFMVAIFFVLSGYVLSRRYMKNNKIETLTSSAIRRFPRLYIPVAVTLVIAFILLQTTYSVTNNVAFTTQSWWLTHFWPKDFSFRTFLTCFSYSTMFLGDNRYDPSMWTMYIEMYGSMLVFALLALTHNTKLKWVLFLLVSLFIAKLFFVLYLGFIIGICLNYIDEASLQNLKYKKVIVPLLIMAGLIFGGFPSWAGAYDQEKFYHFVSSAWIKNNPDAVHLIGATCVVIALLLSPSIQKLFSGRLFVFLGDISFSAYLIHPLIISTLSCFLFMSINAALDHYNLTVGIVFAITIPIVFLVSKAMTKFVDKPGINFSKYLYTRFFKGETN
jgi:peptidoglycan/LPS O-acetylase OafA/YrhL